MRFFSFSSAGNSQTPEYIFGNIAFVLLFIAVLLYWFDSSDSFTESTTDSTKETNSTASFIKQLQSKTKINKNWKNFCMIGANLSLALLLIVRWFESGHFPLSNLYESLIGLSWGFTTVHLIVVLDFTKVNRLFTSTDEGSKVSEGSLNLIPTVLGPCACAASNSAIQSKYSKSNNFYERACGAKPAIPSKHNRDKIGAITAPTALLTSVFATFFLPPEMVRATALIPALKSNWLTMHVTVMVASYAFLLVGSLLSIAFCVYRFIVINKTSAFVSFPPLGESAEKRSHQTIVPSFALQSKATLSKAETPQNFDRVLDSNAEEICIWLNTLSYRILGLGFPLLTIGILSGAVWANEAWGSYWSWDPKETWALITWLVFAVYFHSRYTRNSDTSLVPASIASIGFVTIWICYLGVNLIGTGLHSYGWFVY